MQDKPVSIPQANPVKHLPVNHLEPLRQAPQHQTQFQNQSHFFTDSGDKTPLLGHEPECSYSRWSHALSTHDPKLNTDGDALEAFLIAQSSLPPQYLLEIHGTHTEIRTVPTPRTEPVTDFQFFIDISGSGYILREHGVVQWSCPDEDAAYRGGMVCEVDAVDGRRKATWKESKATADANKARKANGFPPWHPMSHVGDLNELSVGANGKTGPIASSKTLREWIEEYITSPELLKEFVYKKIVYGWDAAKMSESIINAIKQQTKYGGNIECKFIVSPARICILADNRFSRLMSSTTWKILGTMILVYPTMWLYKRFGKSGGGMWKVVGAAYAVGCEEELNANAKGVDSESEGQGTSSAYRGEEFFKEWEPIIVQSAASRLRRNEPMRRQGPY